MSAQKYLVSIILAATTLVAGSIAQASTSVECLSYSKKLSVQILFSRSEAALYVSNSTETGEYALNPGESIKLFSNESSAKWVSLKGTSLNNQTTTFSFQKADLAQDEEFEAFLNVGADWTDTMEVVKQMTCRVVRN